jgi:hypothetical protein
MSLSIEEELEKTGKPKKLLCEQMGPTMPRNKTGDQNSSARLVAVSESGNHLVSFSNSIVFTTSFALTDHYGKPNFTKKTGPKIEPGSRAGVWSRTIVRMTARPSVPLQPPEQRSDSRSERLQYAGACTNRPVGLQLSNV